MKRIIKRGVCCNCNKFWSNYHIRNDWSCESCDRLYCRECFALKVLYYSPRPLTSYCTNCIDPSIYTNVFKFFTTEANNK